MSSMTVPIFSLMIYRAHVVVQFHRGFRRDRMRGFSIGRVGHVFRTRWGRLVFLAWWI